MEPNVEVSGYMVIYRDDGPVGVSVQSMDVTSPWHRTHIFRDGGLATSFYESFYADIEKWKQVRKNPRVEIVYSDITVYPY